MERYKPCLLPYSLQKWGGGNPRSTHRATPPLVVLVVATLLLAWPASAQRAGVAAQSLETDWRALIALYEATGGSNWERNTNWSTSQSVIPSADSLDEWHGVTVENGRVTSLGLAANNLLGSIPSEIGNVSELRSLNLKYNRLSGELPRELGSLSNLREVWLHTNAALAGALPQTLSNLSALEMLWIGGTELCIPPDAALQEWLAGLPRKTDTPACLAEKDRTTLAALYEATDGDNWKHNTNWSRHATGISAANDDWYGVTVNDGRVTALRLHYNNLVGELPGELGNLDSLEVLELQHNALRGPLPASLAKLSKLERLVFDGTELCIPPDSAFGVWYADRGAGSMCDGREAFQGEGVSAVSAGVSGLWRVLAMVLLLTLVLTLMLWYRQKGLPSEPPEAPVQADDGQVEALVARSVEPLSRTLSAIEELVQGESRQVRDDFARLLDTFLTMRKNLDEREQEIQRLKRGYDNEIFRRFVRRFIHADQAVQDYQQAGSADADGLMQIHYLLEDAFAECNVERFEPKVGSDYRRAFGVADYPKKVSTSNAGDHFRIAAVLEAGYLIRNGDHREVVVPAKVKIHIFHAQGDA